jgi:5-methylthioadenosine/S-adenosylhomocysteine deaminase
MTTLVHGCALLTGDVEDPQILAGGALVGDDGAIVAVGEADALRREHAPAAELGGDDVVVMPGLVNAHVHGFATPALQLGLPDGPYDEWMMGLMGVSGADHELELEALTGLLIASGVTTTIWSHFPAGGDLVEEAQPMIDAFARAGIRLGCALGYVDRNFFTWGDDARFLASLPADLRAFAEGMAPPQGELDVETFIAACQAIEPSDLLAVHYGPVAPRLVSPAAMEKIAAAASADERRGVHMHLLDYAEERTLLEGELGRSLVPWLDEIGLLGPRSAVTHVIHATTDDMDLLAERETTVIANTSANLRLGAGITKVGEMRRRGVPVAIGTDDMTLGLDTDLLSELRLATTLARLEDRWTSPAETIALGTAAGARAAGFGDRVGTLAAGKRADIVLLDYERISSPGAAVGVTPLDLVAAKATAADVRTVLVDGRVLYRDGRHETVDPAPAIERMRGEIAAVTASSEAADYFAQARRVGRAAADFIAAA